MRAMEQRILNTRSRALQTHNLRLFMRHVDKSVPGLAAHERQWFHNIVQLPLATYSMRVLPSDWPLQGHRQDGVVVRVPRLEQTMQLRGYDDAPVRTVIGLAFAFKGGQARIVGDRGRDGKPIVEGEPQPWMLSPIRVRQQGDVLGIFDPGTWHDAREVVDTVNAGIREDSAAIPYSWNTHVVVYSFSSQSVLKTFQNVPGGNITHLGAMTFPVHTSWGAAEIASSRFVVLPSSLRAGPDFLARITRHELGHVAIGVHDDGVPAWLSEGLAEWLAARPLPAAQRNIPTVALTKAQQPAAGLPATATFNNGEQDWHYALAWMACDYLAATKGEGVLWQLLDAMHRNGQGTPDARQDAVLIPVTGLDSHQLAQAAQHRILQTYG